MNEGGLPDGQVEEALPGDVRAEGQSAAKWRNGEPLKTLVRKKIQAAMRETPIKRCLRTTRRDSAGKQTATAKAGKQPRSLSSTSSKKKTDFISSLRDLYNNNDADTDTLDANILIKFNGNHARRPA